MTGAFTGGINAIINDTDIGKGILEGAASGAAVGAFVGAIEKDPANKTTTPSKEKQQSGQTTGGGSGGGPGGNGQRNTAISSVDQTDNRLINPKPGGADGPTITFINDNPNGASPNQPVDPDLASAIERAVDKTGFDVNVNSTTGGHDSGPHVEGRAADINRINGMRVDDPANFDNVKILQEAFINDPNTNQVLGPVFNTNKWKYAPFPSPALINSHKDHIHVNVPR